MSKRERENSRARVYVREKEKLVAFRYLANIGQILTSQVYTFCRATKSASFYLFINCFRVLASGKRGRARNCVNPCPFFSFPSLLFFFFFIFSPFHNRMFTTVCCIRLQLETSTSLFENKIPRIIGIRAVGIVLIGLNSKLMDNGNG